MECMDVKIPRDKMVVLTGLSGSGKSSLAFDTIYAEGQRRYVESLSSYARQFLGQMDKPDVESIEGLSPAISIDQKTTSKNPRSTVGTVTEIHDYLRLLYARIGKPHCPVCGRPITSQSVDQMVDAIMEYPEGTRIMIMAPVVRQRKGEHEKIIERIRKEGFTRVRIDGKIMLINEDEIKLDKKFKHTIEIVVDRIIIKPGQESRISEAVELAMKEGEGLVMVHFKDNDFEKEQTFSTKLACPEHGVSIEELEPRMFSFNSPFGACPTCHGLGFTEKIDPELIIKTDKSVIKGALGTIFASMEGAQIDAFGVGERLITAMSEPIFGGVYKLSALEKKGKIIPKIKISENVEKITNPGFKTLYRLFDKDSNKALADVITMDGEEIPEVDGYEIFDPNAIWKKKKLSNFYAKNMRTQLFKAGKRVYDCPDIEEVKKYCAEQMETLWEETLRFENPQTYYVDLSKKLWDVKHKLIQEHSGK